MAHRFSAPWLALLMSVSHLATADTGSANMASACATLEFMAKMLAINTILPDQDDSWSRLQDMERQLQQLNTLVCQHVIQTSDSRG